MLDGFLVPIHLGFHWVLCHVDFVRQQIVIYDSMRRGMSQARAEAIAKVRLAAVTVDLQYC